MTSQLGGGLTPHPSLRHWLVLWLKYVLTLFLWPIVAKGKAFAISEKASFVRKNLPTFSLLIRFIGYC